jgi:hypothetical protein
MYYYRKFNKCLPQLAFVEGIAASREDVEWEDNDMVGTWGMFISPQLGQALLSI